MTLTLTASSICCKASAALANSPVSLNFRNLERNSHKPYIKKQINNVKRERERRITLSVLSLNLSIIVLPEVGFGL